MRGVALLALMTAAAAAGKDRIAYIEFFGYQGIDVEALRKELPLHEGDAISPGGRAAVRAAVKRITGSDPTDVAPICCIKDGDTVLFIGLAGKSRRPFAVNPRPTLDLSLSAELLKLAREMDDAEAKSTEEVSPPVGYRFMKDKAAQTAELRVREYARGHVPELTRVLSKSAHSEQRAIAADALGYADRSQEQIDALVVASHDSSDEVRNNATRALSEILDGDPKAVSMIPAAPFVEMLHSATWTDRNKAGWVVASLTQARDVALLANLKARAWDALVEMACWRIPDWNSGARMILARIAGIPEQRARELTLATPAAFLEAIGQK
jgi:hypothetical protein